MFNTYTNSEIRLQSARINFFMFLCVAINVVILVSSKNVEFEYPRFSEIPDGDGVMHQVDLEEKPETSALSARVADQNQYLFFTRIVFIEFVVFTKKYDKSNLNSSQTLRTNDVNSISSSNFNATVTTVIIVHGWRSDQNSDINLVLRDAFLGKDDVNVIVLGWRRLAYSTYPTAVAGVPAVGRGLGQFLAFLNRVTGASFNRMHLVGFSLGAHVVGNAGRELSSRVARITGLDPAGPLWTNNPNRIRATDGVYVEGIHTDGDAVFGLGIRSAIGDADFFPNGGTRQPGCVTAGCDHSRAWQLFAATVTLNHLEGRQCSNMLQVTLDNCRGSTLKMGNDDLNKKGNGIYRLNTKSEYPF